MKDSSIQKLSSDRFIENLLKVVENIEYKNDIEKASSLLPKLEKAHTAPTHSGATYSQGTTYNPNV